MSNPKKTHELIRQNEKIVKKSQKHDANLQKNSILYFQIGLVICLLGTWSLFEMNFETTIPIDYVQKTPEDETFYVDVPLIKPEVPVFDKPKEQKRVIEPNIFIEVPDDTPDKLFKDDPKDPIVNENPPINPDDLPPLDEEPEIDNVPFMLIEKVPIYPGCENKKTNMAKRKCMSEKITKLVQRKFDTGLGEELGLSGKQTIQTQFKIDKTGHVIEIKTRGPHPQLEKEAKRVINKIPEMTPGKQRDKNVGVIYTLPIIFRVQN